MSNIINRLSDQQLKAVNTVETDYRAEVLAASLIELGYDSESIVLTREKLYKRGSLKDIHEMRYGYSMVDMIEYLYITISKPGLYDNLPEGLFHQSHEVKQGTGVERVIAQIKRFDEEEAYFRLFFRPFEISIDHMLVEAQLYERRFDKLSHNNKLSNIFIMYRNILEHMTFRQIIFFVKIIPELYRISADLPLASEVLGILFGMPAKVEHAVHQVPERGKGRKKNVLGKSYLGVNTALGSTAGNNKAGIGDILITMGPADAEHLRSFHPELANGKLLNALFGIMFPIDCRYQVKYMLAEEQKKSELSTNESRAYLGVNAYLSQAIKGK